MKKTQTMTQQEELDITKDLTQPDRWTVAYLERIILTMPMDKRYDYYLKVTPNGVRVLQKDLDEGKVG